MLPTDLDPMFRGQSPQFSDRQILSAVRSGRLSRKPATPAYASELLQRIRRLRQQQTKARMNENIRREAFLMSKSFGS